MKAGYNHATVAVVDAFSSGAYFPPALRCRGIDVVHVRTACEPAPGMACAEQGDFIDCIDAREGLAGVVRRLKGLRVSHVLAGAETGSSLADELALALGVATANAAAWPGARQDKRAMHRCLDAAGVPIPWQIHFDERAEQVWSTPGPVPPRLVVKPAASAGSDHVMVCDDAEAVRRAVASIVANRNVFGVANCGVVVQGFLAGDEYAVNTVSVAGQHHFREIWKSVKSRVQGDANGRVIYDRQILEDASAEPMAPIRDYVARVLDALGVRWGASHTEIIMTAQGPRILETATRPAGGMDPCLSLRVFGRSYIDEVVDAYLIPEWARARPSAEPLKLQAMGVSLISGVEGRLLRDIDLEPIRSLASYHGHRMALRKGDRLLPTVDLGSKPGGVYLCHVSREQLEADALAIRAWEREEFARCIQAH